MFPFDANAKPPDAAQRDGAMAAATAVPEPVTAERAAGQRDFTLYPPAPPRPAKAGLTLAYLWLVVKLVAWKLLTIPIIGLIYGSIVAEGMMRLVPTLALKVSKLPVPGLHRLKDYEGFHRLAIAHLLAIVLMFVVWHLWVRLMTLWLDGEHFTKQCRWNPETYARVIGLLGAVVLGGDAILFYYSVSHSGWGSGTVFSFAALICTACYLGVIVTISFVTFALENPLQED